MADVADGQVIADVACGIGGTLRAIAASCRPARLIGVNIDRRQLDLCPGGAEGVTLLCADACALPFAQRSLDRVVCIEAAFHFSDRRRFLKGVADCLRPGGMLAHADILIDPAKVPARLRSAIEEALRRDFAPWPAPWTTTSMLGAMLADAGLRVEAAEDASSATRSSYRFVAPGAMPTGPISRWPGTYVQGSSTSATRSPTTWSRRGTPPEPAGPSRTCARVASADAR